MGLFSGAYKSLFGDGGASKSQEAALRELQGVRVPTAEEMQIQLQQLVEAGVLTPERAQYYAQNPNAFLDIVMPSEGRDAQVSALSGLSGLADDGNDAQSEAAMAEILGELRSAERGNRDAILQSAAARGGLTGGQTLAAQLVGNQQQDAQANKNAIDAAAAAEARKMDALKSMASIGQGLQAQDWNQQAQTAQAANAINQFNAANQNAMSQFNTNTGNAAAASNLANKQAISNQNVSNANANAERNSNLKQQQFNNQLNKANAISGQYNNIAQSQQNAANQNAAFIGGLANAAVKAGTMAAGGGMGGGAPAGAMGGNLNLMNGANPYSAYQNPFMAHGGEVRPRLCMEEGGIVPGEAPFPGDTEANDIVPANLSPGEVVVPRTEAQSPEGVMSFLARIKGHGVAPKVATEDIVKILEALTQMRGM